MSGPSRLVADVGGTHARLALSADVAVEPGFELSGQRIYKCRDHDSFASILEHFRALHGGLPEHACIAVAGPVCDGRVAMTNLDWNVDADELRTHFGFSRVDIINDMVATACALTALPPDRLKRLKSGRDDPDATRVVIGVGTGLGVAALARCGDRWYPLASEGGHASLGAPMVRAEQRWRGVLHDSLSHISSETVLGAPGVAVLYRAAAEVAGIEPEALTPREITTRARDGEDKLCVATMNTYVGLLASMAGDLALTFGARGGVCLAGELLRFIETDLASEPFRTHFVSKGPMTDYLTDVPVDLILEEHPGLPGSAAWARLGIEATGAKRRRGAGVADRLETVSQLTE